MRRFRAKRSRPRKTTLGKISREQLRAGALMNPPVDWVERPRTWGECREMGAGPCPFVSCKHHLYLDVNPESGTITLNFPDLEPWELSHTCSLDVAARGAITLEQVGVVMNLTRERIRQIEVIGMHKLKAAITDADEHPAEVAA